MPEYVIITSLKAYLNSCIVYDFSVSFQCPWFRFNCSYLRYEISLMSLFQTGVDSYHSILHTVMEEQKRKKLYFRANFTAVVSVLYLQH